MIPASESTSLPYSDSLVRRSNILQAIIRLSNEQLSGLNRNELLLRCAEILLKFSSFDGGWIGRHVPETGEITPLAFLKTSAGNGTTQEVSRKLILLDGSMINAGLEGFVRAAALEMTRGIRINVVSPIWVRETMERMGMDSSGGMPAKRTALAYRESVESGRTGEVLDVRDFG